MTSRVRELVQRVAESDEQRDYHPEIASRFPNRTALSALEREIAEEVAYSLGKAGKKVERLLAELTQLGQRLDLPGTLSSEERSLLILRFNQTRQLADGALRDLRIQREALGFRRHDDILRHYALPAARR